MQARVIQGSQDAFDALVYEVPDNKLMNYMQNSINVATEKLGNVGSYFLDTAKNMYDRYNNSHVINAAKALVSTVDTHINPDVIINYNEENIFNATPKMQQYIMVQPEMWELNKEQHCSAYDGVYHDVDPNVNSHEEHIRYQEVMDGIVQYDENGDSFVMTYSSSDMEELHHMDQFSILDTWDVVANLIASDIDPSSLTDGTL